MKRIIKIVIVVAVLGAVIGAIAYYRIAGSILPVDVIRVARGPVEETVDETAQALLDRVHTVSTASAGILLPVTREAGEAVEEGEVVARIDPSDIKALKDAAQAQVEAFEAQAKSAEAQKPKPAAFDGARLAVEAAQKRLSMAKKEAGVLEEYKRLAETNLVRTRALFKEGLAREAQLDEVKSRADALSKQFESACEAVSASETAVKAAQAAQALLKQASGDPEFLKDAFLAQARASRASLHSLEIEERRLLVKAPFKGVLLERYDRGSRIVSPGTPVFLLGDPTTLEVEVEVLSDDIPLIELDQRVVLFGGALGKNEIVGSVHNISPKAFSKISSLGIEQKRVKVRIEVPPGTALRHGYRVEARIVTASRPDVLRVPGGAVFRRDGKDHVFSVSPEKTLRLVPVTLGLSNEDWAEITEGLVEGDEVVTDPREELKEGMKIRMVGEEKGAG